MKRIVRLSGLAAAMGPEVKVGRWMKTVEDYLVDSGLEWTVIRPSPFMQNFLKLYPKSKYCRVGMALLFPPTPLKVHD